jgi:hypothetical protein
MGVKECLSCIVPLNSLRQQVHAHCKADQFCPPIQQKPQLQEKCDHCDFNFLRFRQITIQRGNTGMLEGWA